MCLYVDSKLDLETVESGRYIICSAPKWSDDERLHNSRGHTCHVTSAVL